MSHLRFWNAPAYVHVTVISAKGWQDSRFTLAQFAAARPFLARCEVVCANVVGSLVDPQKPVCRCYGAWREEVPCVGCPQ